MAKIVWTETALSDLDNIGEYISKDSVKYAELTVLELFQSVDILETHPYAGVKVPEFKDESIRQIVYGNYRVIYEIINDFRIDILTVHHCARLISNNAHFKKE